MKVVTLIADDTVIEVGFGNIARFDNLVYNKYENELDVDFPSMADGDLLEHWTYTPEAGFVHV